jgi:aldehyde:ferredoxin oxidoreductase
MAYGYTGKILIINLTTGNFSIDEHDEIFYRQYLGGPGIGAYYALREIKPGIDPLAPENVLIFAAGVVTGTPAPAVPRYTVCAKSPLTGGIGRSEAGGWWGPELKAAGFDAVVVKGKADHPVYLKIEDGTYELRDARHLWGKETDECQRLIREELGARYRVAQIGPGGENMVLFANIVNELAHFNGRNGLGAVMGAKNLKAIAVKGSNKVPCFDEETVKNTTRWAAANMKDHPPAYGLHKAGTPGGVTIVNAGGALPTRNWQENTFDRAAEIGSDKLEEILIQRGGCYSCPIRCKRVVKVEKEDLNVDPALGGPEYETLVCLGSNLGIGNIEIIAKANELCNKYTLDTISMGMTISFAMECFEKGLITTEDTGGLELKFGNEAILLPLIKLTAYKEGFGAKLALGSARLAGEIGQGSEQFLLQVKNQEVPAHDPRVKTGVGLQYALSSHGADHWTAQHDPFFQEAGSPGLQALEPLGIFKPVPATALSADKVRLIYYTHLMTVMYDCLGVCVFGYVARSIVPVDKLVEMARAVTGWNASTWGLLKAAERTSVMLRLFNNREGFTSRDDTLPKRLLEAVPTGPLSGKNKIDEQLFGELIKLYYQMAGWDEDGKPTAAKLYELDLDWALEYIN